MSGEAVEQITIALPDLITLDLMLPGLAGTEICKLLQQPDQTRRIPIIKLVAKGGEIDCVVGLAPGLDSPLSNTSCSATTAASGWKVKSAKARH
ncbi:MAG: hypothetical protein O7G31_12765 [Calditrichaeota bacterium]|nr:hypothetical protein [Calditrichota bacterium]